MQENYNYPLDPEWSHSEIAEIISFYNAVELANESGINRNDFLEKYRLFQKIVPMKMDQKNIDSEFELQSGYSIYRTFKAISSFDGKGKFRMK
ncbi:UPF0223 family protein [Companilactobacillus metriopterae]|uniref:UPF0223 family protein n=1 Tax=Companilactobacillus metriopterae TaxID=1909267 RepID=UPI00100B16AC|nr:UPF0223 family protein [Companilactobacillus metriopterae]